MIGRLALRYNQQIQRCSVNKIQRRFCTLHENKRTVSKGNQGPLPSPKLGSLNADMPSSSAFKDSKNNAHEQDPSRGQTAKPTQDDFLAKCAAGRRQINELWARSTENGLGKGANFDASESECSEKHASPYKVFSLIKSLDIDPGKPIENDITRGLGEAVDRLLILAVKGVAWHLYRQEKTVMAQPELEAQAESPAQAIPMLLKCIARNGISLEHKTVQHMFANCYNYAQALSIFEEMKISGMTLDATVYYTMVFCLQRLDEESWGRTFYHERQSMQQTSNEALKFILHGVPNQLLPGNKPHLGRVMYADVPQVHPNGKGHDFDATGKSWGERYAKR